MHAPDTAPIRLSRPTLRAPLVVALLGVVAGAVLSDPEIPMLLRALAAGGLAFLLPGLGLGYALLPRGVLGAAERLTIALGGSLAVTVVGAFLLHVVPIGLSAMSWGMLLGAVTAGSGLVGWARAPRTAAPGAGPAGVPVGARVRRGASTASMRAAAVPLPQVAMLLAAGVLVALSLVVARAGVTAQPHQPFTELWMLARDDGAAVRVGVENREDRDVAYRLVLTLDGRALGGPVTITLADGEATEEVIALPVGRAARDSVEARLWRAEQSPDEPPYRSTRISLRGTQADPP